MKFRTYYVAIGEAREGLTFSDKSLTRQEFLKESLTSTIMERFAKTGILNATVNSERVAQFGDFSQVPNDYFEAACRIKDMQNCFDEMPSKVRAMFNNDLGAFVAFVSDDNNRDRAVELGLLPVKAKVVQESSKAEAAAAAKPDSGAAVAPEKAGAEAKA